ncbi:9203e70e-9c9f-4153-85e8-0ac515cecefc [Sclerotinia trifoliorum]|uniref:9203e70e-9c9f-4153-85e8-0ac515cecefc n=1 Tax=Sclerotinia trifoliorum TaxID=28548 RepID=A0A8H2VPC8_9HELO|nr:9203e70e-9c9f-4153-85e8-0ac515cecefc [Sclerotinia trifoliorum]
MFAGYQNHQAIAIPPNSTYPSTSSIPPPIVPPSGPDDVRRQSTSATAAAPTGLNARSCVTCRRRKVKCDKKVPCSNCTKAQSQCVFPAPGRAPRRPRAGGKPVSDREAELLKRLRRLEGVVEELSGQVEVEHSKASPSSDHSSPRNNAESNGGYNDKTSKVKTTGINEDNGIKKGSLARPFDMDLPPPKDAFTVTEGIGRLLLDSGKSQYVSNPFWAELSQEIAELRAMFDEDEEDSDGDSPIPAPSSITQPDHQSFVMGYSSADVDMKALHPLPSQIPFYWSTFLENVMPLVKLLHVPTMGKIIKEVQHNLDTISRSTEALMFSIYFATITSMSDEEVATNFGVEKETLVRKYRFGTEQSLARASFLSTNEIMTVQAFVLFLTCVRRHDDTRFAWSLTGLVMRIGQSLGLHRDGEKFGLSPYDTEMRRRLWWQICVLDVRASEDHGTDPSIYDHTFDTKFPLSINDADLDPDAKEPPQPREGVSEMTFVLIRFEICALSKRLQYTPPGRGPCPSGNPVSLTLEQKEELIKTTSVRLEEKYLKYCENAGPLYWVAGTVARLIFAKMSLIIYHPLIQPGKPQCLSPHTKDRLLTSSIEIIEYSRILETEASTKKWGWLFRTYVQWHAIAFILGELSIRRNSPLVERAWQAIDSAFDDWSDAVGSSKRGMFWQPMRKLMARARRKREENMTSMEEENDKDHWEGAPHECITAMRRTQALINSEAESPPVETEEPQNYLNQEQNHSNNFDTNVSPQVVGMGMLAPEQVQHQLQIQQQQQQLQGQNQIPWIMDDNALLDLDMSALNGDVSWTGWDDLARDFQNQTGQQVPDANALGGAGNWW